MWLDLSDHIVRRQVISRIENDIDSFSRYELSDDPRKHLGASIIGDLCSAKVWNNFRWLKEEDLEGRKLRLFNRGHTEESRIIRWLTGIGFDVRALADDGKQFRISGVDGHYGGSLDAMAMAPARYEIADPVVLEFKTHNEKSFTKLKKEGLIIAQPTHYAQMCCYGRPYSLRYGLYIAVNKNTDEIYIELVPLDWHWADQLSIKAETIIHSQIQPAQIAKTPTFWRCKPEFCHFSGICHSGEKPAKNCRSCFYATPVADGQWECTNQYACGLNGVDAPLPDALIAAGCSEWMAIINA